MTTSVNKIMNNRIPQKTVKIISEKPKQHDGNKPYLKVSKHRIATKIEERYFFKRISLEFTIYGILTKKFSASSEDQK